MVSLQARRLRRCLPALSKRRRSWDGAHGGRCSWVGSDRGPMRGGPRALHVTSSPRCRRLRTCRGSALSKRRRSWDCARGGRCSWVGSDRGHMRGGPRALHGTSSPRCRRLRTCQGCLLDCIGAFVGSPRRDRSRWRHGGGGWGRFTGCHPPILQLQELVVALEALLIAGATFNMQLQLTLLAADGIGGAAGHLVCVAGEQA